jgi:FixJ family two-component response regulator
MTHQDLEKTIEEVQDLTAERRGLAKEFGRKKSRISKLDKRSRQLMQLVSHGFCGGGL